MLNRQKVLLAILQLIARPVSPTVLVKIAFLLRQNAPLRDDRTYYEFVPYKFGPFSFALYREMDALRRDAFVAPTVDRIELANRARATEKVQQLSRGARDAVESIVAEFGGVSQKALLRQVYRDFPWYATHSELSDLLPDNLPAAPTAPPAIYTVGYEDKSVDGFFNGLLVAGIRGIIDVRANPISRKYGFARRSMSEIAGKLGLAYTHIPELGICSADRSGLDGFASYQRLLDRYRANLLPQRMEDMNRALSILRVTPSALLCVEKDIRCCHRGRLAEIMAEHSDLTVVHI